MDNTEPVEEVTDNSVPATSLLNQEKEERVQEEASVTTEATNKTKTFSYEDLMGVLPEDVKGNTMWSKFKDIGEFAKSMTELNSLVGKKGDIPKPDADQAEWDDFYSKLGRPEKPSDYGIKLKDGLVGEEKLNHALELAHKAGLSPKQTDILINGLQDMQLEDGKTSYQNYQESLQQEATKLEEAWGNGMDDMIETVTRFQKSLGVFELFESKGLNTDADLLILMGNLAGKLSEDPMVGQSLANTNAGLDNQIIEIEQQIKQYVVKGEKVPQHLKSAREDLYNKKYAE